MTRTVRELLVFMASPADLTDERSAVREVERRVNAIFEHHGVRVRVIGWEQVAPEAGRPQELINPLVHDCDVFIGLLSRRWGSETGTHSSGFEEEFELALSRRATGVTPVIGMFFAEIPADALVDPGSQLKAILAFQKRVREERLALYKSFRNADHLKVEILDFLTPRVLELADLTGGGRDEIGAAPAPTGSGPETEVGARPEPGTRTHDSESAEPAATNRPSAIGAVGEHTPDEAQAQIAAALRQLASWFEEPITAETEVPDRDRVTLVGAAFAKDDNVLGTHHVHRLYKRRDEIAFTVGEADILYRTYFGDFGATDRNGRTMPIWGIVNIEQLGPRFLDDLASLAAGDDVRVARGCLRFVTEHRIRPDGLWPSNGFDETDDSTNEDQVLGISLDKATAAGHRIKRWRSLFEHFEGLGPTLNYMASVATPEDVPFLETVAVADGLDESSRDAVSALAAALDGNATPLAHHAPSRYATGVDTILELITAAMPSLGPEAWAALLTGGHRRVAAAAAVQLAANETLSESQVKAALALEDATVESAMVDRAGQDSPWGAELIGMLREADQYQWQTLIARLLAATCPPEMLEELDRDDRLGAVVWEALTIQDPLQRADQARAVLDDEADFINERAQPLMAEHKIVARHIIDTAKRAACTTLARLTDVDAEDIQRVTSELRRDCFISREAALLALIELLSRPTISAIAGTPGPPATPAIPETAYTMPDLGVVTVLDSYWVVPHVDVLLESCLADRVVEVWRNSEISQLRAAARSWELAQPSMSDEELEEALYLDDSDLRMVAIDQLLARWNDEHILELLGRYDNQGRPYWYNVITAMDERLFGYRKDADDSNS